MDNSLKKEFLRSVKTPFPDPHEEPSWRDKLKGVNGIDRMSPYCLPTSAAMYNDLAEAINKKAFLARFTQAYTPIAGYFRKFNITPYFDPGENPGMSLGMITIAGMVELVTMNEPFQLMRDQDFDTIITLAQTYYDHIIKFNNQKLQLYAKRMQPFMKIVREGRARMLRRTGQADTKMDFVQILERIFGGGR